MGRVVWMVVCVVMFMLRWESTSAQMAPALFVFGDSLVDVGNNNHLPLSIVKADFPHNGIDFPNHKATGRFTNGKNAADFLADRLGLPSSPPYLSMVHDKSKNFVTGVNFASGGAGILDGTDQLYKQSITMNRQIEYFATVHKTIMQQMGESSAAKTLSKSVFAIVIGSNDILGYFGSSPLLKHSKKGTPQEFVDSLLVASKGQLKRIYDLGARKIAILGISAVGCCPSQRDLNKTEVCNEEANFWATKYNQGLQLALQNFQTEHKDFQYTYFDTYTVLLNLIRHPATYGFKEEKAACCGLGELNAKLPCLPIAGYCHNRSDHIFWDLYHPTEAAARIIIDTAFSGPKQYAFPVNVRQLASA